MPTAHLIYGYIGSGKTTLARQLEQRSGAVRYSPDEWMTRLFGEDPPQAEFAGHAQRVQSLIDEQWQRVLAAGVDVVLDFGFWSRTSRDEARQRVLALNAVPRLYWVRCDRATALARCLARNRDLRGSLFIAEQTFELLEQRFQPLDADEPFELSEPPS
jgi:predicted kinase